MMHLDGLRGLYRDMKRESQERAFFSLVMAKARLEVVFFIDESPFVLLISVRGLDSLTFEVPVRQGFMIEPVIDNSVYRALWRALGLEWDPSNRFSTSAFFRDLNARIPTGVPVQIPQSHVVGRRNLEVEERHKTYFIGWRDNKVWGANVSPENLEKTRRLMGSLAHQRSRRGNFSSRWTEDPERRMDDYLPSER